MPAEKWTPGQRSEALALAAEHGPAAAAEATGIPSGTIRSWGHRETDRARPFLPAELLVPGRPWHERQEAMVAGLGEAAVDALEAVRSCLATNRHREARDAAVTLGILLDKLQLLAGAATSRTESLAIHASADAMDRRIDSMMTQILDNAREEAKRLVPPTSREEKLRLAASLLGQQDQRRPALPPPHEEAEERRQEAPEDASEGNHPTTALPAATAPSTAPATPVEVVAVDGDLFTMDERGRLRHWGPEA